MNLRIFKKILGRCQFIVVIPFEAPVTPSLAHGKPFSLALVVFGAPLDCASLFFSLRGCLRLKRHIFFALCILREIPRNGTPSFSDTVSS